MSRNFAISVLALSLSSCAPPLVWGGDEATKARLLEIVPLDSTVGELEAKAEDHDWRILNRDDRSFVKGKPHYFADECEHQGGVSRYIVVAEYGVFTTSVETVWLFNGSGRLGDVCIRRTTEAP